MAGKNLKFWILFLLALLVLGGVFAWQRWQQSSYQAQISNGVKNVATSAADISTSSTALTAGWKTYRNEQYGFEFKYPEDSQIEERPYAILVALPPAGSSPLLMAKNLSIEVNACPSVEESIASTGTAVEDVFVESTVIDISTGTVSVGDVVFARREFLDYEAATEYDNVNFTTQKDGKCFDLKSSIYSQYPDAYAAMTGHQVPELDRSAESKVFDEILSTFKFISPTSSVDTSSWKTYRNEEYGFEFKYPTAGVRLETDSIDPNFLIGVSYSRYVFGIEIPRPTTTTLSLLLQDVSSRVGKEQENGIIPNRVKEVAFAGSPAIETIYTMNGRALGKSINIIRNGLFYDIYREEAGDSTLDTILSTFKFIQ